MWNLGVYLVLMVGEQIPGDDNEWDCLNVDSILGKQESTA